ncbi:protein singed wings 2 isoform X1 [Trichogramma pretiosum]|uniref:protein singed wings 2 isoform X1 n=1 Tax=Trichogramma pretiosum TaxID=7493 RepID=UPI0006C952B8|nr:protein singed wings 2 isoform X1 [Trichogramma pretiosum]
MVTSVLLFLLLFPFRFPPQIFHRFASATIVLNDNEENTVVEFQCKARFFSSTESNNSQDDNNTMSEILCFYGAPNVWWDLQSPQTIVALIIQDWQDENLDATRLLFTISRLRRFSIENGNLSRILTPFPATAQFLELIEITGTKLGQLTDKTFANLPALRTLDLRNNSIATIDPTDLTKLPQLEYLYLTGNQWRCDLSSSWFGNATFASLVRRIVDREEMRCHEPHKGRPLLPVMEVIQRLEGECRLLVAGCSCELVYVVSPKQPPTRQRQFMAFATVNCSHRGFTDMPAFLPADTTTLHLEGNKISDLTPLKTNPAYRKVVHLYMDNNTVETLAFLDGAYWLETFQVLSLRGNRMTDFPTYAFESVWPSKSVVSLYLGDNPWRCDCQFTPGFQELLIKYGDLVKDASDIRCASGNTEFADKPVRELSRTEICVPMKNDYWVHLLDILNVFLGGLIFLLLCNLLHDYYCYKKTGKLPWLASKLP